MFKSLVACLLSAILLVSFSMFAGGWSDEIVYEDLKSAVAQCGIDQSEPLSAVPVSWTDGIGVFELATDSGNEVIEVRVKMDRDPLFFGEFEVNVDMRAESQSPGKLSYASGSFTYSSCYTRYGGKAYTGAASYAACNSGYLVAGSTCDWSSNQQQDPEFQIMPNGVSCEYNTAGAYAEAWALCCRVVIAFP